ncbi:MAG TPA: hypothetical protein VMZ90_00595 [Vicinamibacterales bacterium]|nr:hypothetical protein [Vicinamibacterales bacterium]
MRAQKSRPTLVLIGLCFAAACGQSAPTPEPSAAAPNPSQWIGKWFGPEGTYVDIAKDAERYRLIIANLDGPRTFQGVADGRRLMFERDGVRESIKAGTGAETGMKWLLEKKDCLVVKPGEGYCRG